MNRREAIKAAEAVNDDPRFVVIDALPMYVGDELVWVPCFDYSPQYLAERG